jgi:deoxyribodipyrimidine photo-lyase
MQSDLFTPPSASTQSIVWTPSREAGLARLDAFLPAAGSRYTRSRNTDFGPHDRSNVSCLSPWLARRLITEEEVVAAVMKHHSFAAAEKFIQEVFWRTYWKGWLELRPSVLVAFDHARKKLANMAREDAGFANRLAQATSGQTGIACFDAWVQELKTIGWLHNHTRMWFASIWIFTLRLPWQLGADFFYKHLLDADPASNTLSWRWVAGLHTKGKHYLARASNIEIHTNGRFNPAGQLDERAEPLSESYQTPGPGLVPQSGVLTTSRIGLLVTQEDLCPQDFTFGAKVVGVATLTMQSVGAADSPRHVFDKGALGDATHRVGHDFDVEPVTLDTIEAVRTWATNLGVREIATPYAPTGLVAWELSKLSALLAQEGIKLVQVQRDWDQRAWPLATGGFFKLKEKLPSLIKGLRLS